MAATFARILLATLTAVAAMGTATGPTPARAQDGLRAQTLTDALDHPWGLAFLPDGAMLVTERGGRLRRFHPDTGKLEVIDGVPPVAPAGQGGLLDVAVSPQFRTDGWVYWSYAERGTGEESGLAGTAVARGRLVGRTLQDVSVIFRQQPKVAGAGHYGSRLVFARDGLLFITLGERMQDRPAAPGRDYAQNVDTHLGKVVRIHPDGRIPDDNPRLGKAPGVWSYGHRNPQGAALHPDTGELWITEHGPQGGDELNHVRKGGNYGWPLRSYGCPYGSPVGEKCRVNGGTHAPDFIEPVATWVPTSIAPSGLVFVDSPRYPEWRGQVLMGALAGQALWRVVLDGDREVARQRVAALDGERVRDVRQAPDGWIYVLTDEGRLIRLAR